MGRRITLSVFSDEYNFVINEINNERYIVKELILPTDSTFRSFQTFKYVVVNVGNGKQVGMLFTIVEMLSHLHKDDDMELFDYHLQNVLRDINSKVNDDSPFEQMSVILNEFTKIINRDKPITNKKYKKHKKNLISKLHSCKYIYQGEEKELPDILIKEIIYTYGVEDLETIIDKFVYFKDFMYGKNFTPLKNGLLVIE